jgi:hypothetical protein
MPAIQPSLDDVLTDARRVARDQVAAAWQIYIDKVREQLDSGWREHIESILDDRLADVRAVLAPQIEQMVEHRVSQEAERLRRGAVSALNQAIRRLKVFENELQWCTALVDASLAYCEQAALFLVSGPTFKILGERRRGQEASRELPGELALESAPALASAVESGDVVVTIRSSGELSVALVDFFGSDPAQKVYLFPLSTRQKVVAVLYADGGATGVDHNGLELLTTLAAMSLEIHLLDSERRPSNMVTIPPPKPEGPGSTTVSWSSLSKEDQELHLRAQRFARVKVAEMRLYKSQAVKSGRSSQSLYSLLRTEIDAGREAFREQFLAASPTMVDYFHVELLRTLANEDAALLGADYPGPLT